MSYSWGHGSTKPPGTLDSNEPPALMEVKPRVTGLILSVLSCFIISINLLVAAALLKLLIKKGSQSWCFVLNLALADALVGVAITGLATEDLKTFNITRSQRKYNLPTNPGPPALGKTQCLMRMAFVVSPCIASILSMFLISLDRYAAIKVPLRYSRLSGKGTAVGSLLAVWISSFTVGFLPVMVQQLQTDDYNGICAFFSVIQQVDMIILFSVCFFPLFAVFVYIYLDILKISCSHQKQILQIQQAGSRMSEQHHKHHPLHQELRTCFRGHVKALRTVAVLVGCFFILWFPFFVACLVHLLCKSCKVTEMLESHLWILGLCNSFINPVVYAFWLKDVRLQLAAMFSCFGKRSSAAGPPHTMERCSPQLPGLTQAGAEILELSPVQPKVHNL
ncbi:glucose-dependent insulinotropic receptor [Halichoeres trimaculatus]|uniref:glucose-dependent insulinotropic receptor n=1 Tax=Halichoeres trimaculatus TaxID=147232 RepID=UPI003D9F1296